MCQGPKGEVTVFLSLLLLLLLALIGGVIVANRIQVSKSYARGDVDIAMNSVFAEYQIDLLEKFGIFALDASYEKDTYKPEKILDRLQYYGANKVDFEITSIQLLTDHNASAYQEQIIYYMEQKYGLDKIKSYLGITDLWKSQEIKANSVEDKIEKEKITLQQKARQAETNLTVEGNPLEHIESIRGTSILNLVIDDSSQISKAKINLEHMASHRTLVKGSGAYSQGDTNIDANRLLVGEYILEMFKYGSFSTKSKSVNNVEDQKNNNLQYELEYILEGKSSDIENLEGVVNSILLLRTGVNYLCLCGSATKQGEAQALALAIATVSGAPYLEAVLKESLLLAWAYAESVVEVKSLLQGGRLPLVKSEMDWNLQLSKLLTFGKDGNITEQTKNSSGMSYKDYLRMLIYLENKEQLVMRSLDLVEISIQEKWKELNKSQNAIFQVDHCVSKLELMCDCKVLKGYSYAFPAYYAYQ